MFVPSFRPNLWIDFSETWHANRFRPNLKHGQKNLENSYHGNEKKTNIVFCVRVKMPRMVFQ